VEPLAANRRLDSVDRAEKDLNADALRGRQSVRATFRLPTEMVSLLSIAASHLGLKQKSLFDQLVEVKCTKSY